MVRLKQLFTQTYFGRLYKNSKFLFIIIFLFFAGTVLANVVLIPTTPFFVWDMFSSPANKNEPVVFYQVVYNEKVLPPGHTWKSAQTIILLNQLKYYADFRNNNNTEDYAASLKEWETRHSNLQWLTKPLPNSTLEFEAFPGWYKKFVSGITGEEIKSVSLVKKTARYSNNYTVYELSSDTLVMIK